MSNKTSPYSPITTADVAFRGRHMTIGRFFAKPGKLDALLEGYYKHAFEPLRSAPALVTYALVKDEANSAFVTVSTWTSYEDCVAALSTPELQAGIVAMRTLMPECIEKPPIYEDLPVYASCH